MNKLYALATKLKNLKKNLLKEVAVTALNHYKDKFVEGNGKWEGQSWEQPKRKTEGPKKYKVVDKNGKNLKKRKGYLKGFSPRDATRATLVGKGILSRSLKYKTEGSKIVFYSNTPYARRHNEGEAGMPKRQFLGMEKSLKTKIETLLKRKLEEI